nr:hypothetical protein [Burkholderia cenocepacia]
MLEPTQQQPETSALVQQKLDAIAFAVVERIHGTCERVQPHRVLNQGGKGIDATTEVDRLAV